MSYKHLPVQGSSFDPALLDDYFKKDGSEPATGDFDLDGNLITNLSDPVNGNDAANKDYVDLTVAVAAAGKASITHTHNLNEIVSPIVGNGLLVSDGSNWQVRTAAAFSTRELGNGGDGNAIISSSVTLSRTMYYNNLTINNLGILNPGGYYIFVKGILQLNTGGIIQRNGNNGSNATTQAGAAGGSLLVGALTGGGIAGGAGATGLAGAGAVATTAANGGLMVGGITSGNGSPGGSGSAGAGGAFRAGTTAVIFRWAHVATGWVRTGVSVFAPTGQGGPGGSSGGGDGVNLGRGGGGGGSGGGGIFIFCDTLNNNGTIRALGGNGGNGASATVGNVGGGGGGAGGAGGCVVIFCNSIQTQGTITVTGGNGGTGGNGFGTGTAGGNGTAGGTGNRILYSANNNTWTII